MVPTATLARPWLRAVAPALAQPLLPTTMTSASKLSSHAPAAQGLTLGKEEECRGSLKHSLHELPVSCSSPLPPEANRQLLAAEFTSFF